jgi:predicted heme/steroid binding protein/uncharacterized membrane protein
MQTFTKQQLAEFNGQNGKPVYIAHQGIVYDLSESKLWKNGQHMRRHNAGVDLTAEIQAAPHHSDKLEHYPQVGRLEPERPAQRPMPAWLAWLLTANPFLRRHPHPMTVHFPIVFLLADPLFIFLFLITGNRNFETTAFHCLACAIAGLIVAMATGFFTWWYNYMAKKMAPITIKISLSLVALILAIILFVWRWNLPRVITADEGPDLLFLVLSFALIPLTSIVGWFGATLTFPIEKE